MNLGLTGKVALVAASTKGIGRAAAEGFAREGAGVVVNGREAASVREVANEIRSASGAEVIGIAADVSKEEDCRNLIQGAVGHFGRLDILVTNAGGPPSERFAKITDEMWESAFNLTLMSVVHLVRAALPQLVQHGGSVVNVSSYIVKQPDPVMILSDTMRIGVVALLKALSDECAAQSVRFNSVAPGLIWTDRQKHLTELAAQRQGISFEDALKRREESVPMHRIGTPEEMANAIVFLASPAAGYTTGQTLLVDGGLAKGLM